MLYWLWYKLIDLVLVVLFWLGCIEAWATAVFLEYFVLSQLKVYFAALFVSFSSENSIVVIYDLLTKY